MNQQTFETQLHEQLLEISQTGVNSKNMSVIQELTQKLTTKFRFEGKNSYETRFKNLFHALTEILNISLSKANVNSRVNSLVADWKSSLRSDYGASRNPENDSDIFQ